MEARDDTRGTRSFVRVDIPVEIYDEVIRLVARRTKPTTGTRVPDPIDPKDVVRAIDLRSNGLSYRAIAAAMGWNLSKTYRLLKED